MSVKTPTWLMAAAALVTLPFIVVGAIVWCLFDRRDHFRKKLEDV